MKRNHNINEINLTIENIDFWSPHTRNKGGMRIYWDSNIGFGTLDIVKRSGNDGEDFESPKEELILTADTEYMDSEDDKEFTKKIMELVVEKLIIDN